MAMFEVGPVRLNYEIEGDGFPVLVIAPGGMKSANDFWNQMPWSPRTTLVDRFRVIGMDQRNAGNSVAPVSAHDSWATYLGDQLALLDHLGIEQCHVLGMCIGGPFVINLLKSDPDRFCSAVLLQPVGIEDNLERFRDMFDQWAAALADDHPEATPADWSAFRANMWSGDFVLTATRDEVAAVQTPMMVMMGNDEFHPQSTSRDIAALAPNVTFVERWKDADVLDQTDATIQRFLAEHTP